MAISLASKTRTTPPGGAYPYGDIKDDTGSNDGTPVNRQVYADFHQFFARLLDLASVVANGLPDNLTNGFQYNIALQALIDSSVGTAITSAIATINAAIAAAVAVEAGNRASADTALQANITAEGVTRANDDATETAARIAGDATLQAEFNSLLVQTIIPLPVWDMDITASITVAHGLTESKIRRYSCFVYATGHTAPYQIVGTMDLGSGQVNGGGITPTAGTSFLIARTAGGFFDNTNFNGTAASRGFIVIESTP